MYNLGESFKFDLNKCVANPECIFKGNKYRITVLTERLVRLEYNENGIFNDYPTEVVWYRNFSKPNFKVTDSAGIISIKTKYFELFYKKEKPFNGGKLTPMANLKINLLNSDKVWYYGHPEIRNYGAFSHSLDDNKLQKGLFSLDGFVTIDDSKTLLILENGSFQRRNSNGIDIYVFLYNKDFYNCLNDYFEITGRPSMIPRYAFGNWWCKSDYYNDFELIKIANKFKEKEIPISVFMLDHWQTDNNFEFDNNFKNPVGVLNFFNSKKIKLGLTLSDFDTFKLNTNIYNKIKPYLAQDVNGNIPFNLFDARTIDAYLKLIIHPLKELNFDFYFINDFKKNNKERNFLLKHYLYFDKYKQLNNRPLICSFNSFNAPHRYPILYTGKSNVDWKTLGKICKSNILSSNIGVSFLCHDFGGTSDGIEDSELFIRFVQLGVFSPILRLGADVGKYYKREPWKWDVATYEISKKYLNMRYKLIPYIYTESYKYYKYGKPLIEPLYHIYPALYDDPLYSNEYFFGSNILVSPILNKKDPVMNRVIHKMYIPKGVWYGISTGKKYNGDKKYVSFYKDDEYPLFVKAGTIIPQSLNEYNDTSTPEKMQIDIYPGASNTYSIYEDDGISNEYESGNYFITNVEYVYTKNNYKVTILPVAGKVGIIPKKRSYKILFRNTRMPSRIVSYIGNNQVYNKCYTRSSDLIIEIDDVPTTEQMTLICNGDNMEIEAINIINEDIVSIISDLPIKTVVKQKIDSIMFSKDYTIKKKRIEIRKLANGKNWIERKYIDLFLKLLEYIEKV